jgi:uncharacterized membrane protein
MKIYCQLAILLYCIYFVYDTIKKFYRLNDTSDDRIEIKNGVNILGSFLLIISGIIILMVPYVAGAFSEIEFFLTNLFK